MGIKKQKNIDAEFAHVARGRPFNIRTQQWLRDTMHYNKIFSK